MLLCCLSFANAQPYFVNGYYADGLYLVQIDKTHLRGFFEMYSGLDEETGDPMFACVFLLEGTYESADTYTIKAYYPFNVDTIPGELMVSDTNRVQFRLRKDPGGCWNVQPFYSEWVTFKHSRKTPIINLAYVKSDKAFFHQSPEPKTVLKGYLLAGQVIQIEQIQKGFAYCVYEGKQVTKGWIRLQDLVFH